MDDFIDAGLRRHDVNWGDWDMPADLVDIAEATWAALVRLGELGGHDDAVESELDAVRERYATLYGVSAAISQDTATARVAQARIQIEKELRAELEAEYAEDRARSGGHADRPAGTATGRGRRSRRRRLRA